MSAFTNEITGDVSVNNFPATQPVSGTVNVGNFPGTQPVSGTVTVQQATGTNLHVTVDGTVATTTGGGSTATTTQISSTGSNQTLLAANASRKRAYFYFTSGVWDIKLGATASATSRLMRVDAQKFLLEIGGYTGQIDAICTTTAKLVDVTEVA